MTLFIIAAAAVAATFAGGALAIRFRDHLHLVLGFSAGAVAGVAFFDLIPEAFELGGHEPGIIAFFVALGFFAYLILDRTIMLHAHECAGGAHEHLHGAGQRGVLGALTLSLHSFLDGVAVGVGFQASVAVGLVVAAAVLTHDFSDGINTVNFVLHGGGDRKQAFRWLSIDALAPALGILSTLLFSIPENALGLILAVFAGTFLYLSASELIPESHHRHPRALTTVMTLLGALALYAVIKIVG